MTASERPAPRRIKVGKHPGVYYREDAKGRRRYEISYTDSDGVRRWKVIDGGERDAVRTLADVRSRMGRGERVAPSKKTLAEVAKAWLDAQTELRPRTRERYETALEVHVLPRLGRMKVSAVTVDHVAELIASMRAGVYFELKEDGRRVRAVRRTKDKKKVVPAAGWTIRATLTPLSRVMAFAVRRGWAATNPVKELDRGERPSVGRRDMRVLQEEEIKRLVAATSGLDRAVLSTAIFTGMRLSELLGLTWGEIDFDAGFVRVRKQLARTGERVEPKTPQAKRDVVLMPELARILRAYRVASSFSQDDDYAFASAVGTPRDGTNVGKRILGGAIKAAKLDEAGKPKLRFHDCRHTFASLLIAQGRDVVHVSRQLGHANPSITLTVYAHLFDEQRHADDTRAALSARFGSLLEQAMEQTAGDQPRSAAVGGGGEVVAIPLRSG